LPVIEVGALLAPSGDVLARARSSSAGIGGPSELDEPARGPSVVIAGAGCYPRHKDERLMDLKTITATLALLGLGAGACGGEAKKDAKEAAPAKAADPTPADAKPADAKPVDAKPVDAKPADAKPGEMKCGEGKCGEGSCGGAKHGDGKAADGKAIPVDGAPAGGAAPADAKTDDGKKS
jgi:hypothetical protein